ncbi:hypothetical protein [Nocardia aurantia]|uniref:Dihydrodipicolinate reductase n=1 Tax=Nocardia aurantia TaxID=2585199 RepID=A0A7K0DRP9_9NOCA|nr:hypothetical protein [Nocardia aurantia]MQY27494.1 hypothetical protein [Nocardia aurantia]
MTTPLPVAVLGTGPLAERIAARPEIVAGQPSSAAVVIHLTADGGEIAAHLRAGRDVVTALPLEALALDEIREACRTGSATLHAAGGFQSAVAARLTRSLAATAQVITRIELTEEIDLPDGGVYPWNTVPGDALPGYYFAGLRVLEAAAFPDVSAESPVLHAEDAGARHTLGERLGYRSIRTRGGADVPLRYRLAVTSALGTATVSVDFHPTAGIHPADHLTLVELLRAVGPVRASGPGIVSRDLAITHLVADDRLTVPAS